MIFFYVVYNRMIFFGFILEYFYFNCNMFYNWYGDVIMILICIFFFNDFYFFIVKCIMFESYLCMFLL